MKVEHLVFLTICMMSRLLLVHGFLLVPRSANGRAFFVTTPTATVAIVPGNIRQRSFFTTTTALSMTVTLYGHPGTRSPLINWACHELGVDFSMGDLSQNPHPFGQIPCLTDDKDVVVFESGAILQYLYQTYGAAAMTNSKAASAAVTSWIVWANASLDPICFLETPQGKVYDTGLRQQNRRINQLEAILRQNQQKSHNSTICLIPELDFCTADVAVASYLLYVLQFFPNVLPAMLTNEWTTIVEYMQASVQRPAYAQAFGPAVQAALLEQLQQARTSP